MASNFNLNTENKEEWLTPKWIIDELGEFDLDLCRAIEILVLYRGGVSDETM